MFVYIGMCWNREVSIVSGTSAMALSLYLLVIGKGNDIPIALVSMAIALMQFAEALMWDGNIQGGRLGLLALFLQPLALGVGILLMRGLAGLTNWMLWAFVGVWCILALPTLRQLLSQEWPIETGCGGHLRWSFLGPMLASPFAPLYWIVMLGGWLLFQPFQEGVFYAAMAIGTLLITRWYTPGEWGSLWCFIANLLPLGRLL